MGKGRGPRREQRTVAVHPWPGSPPHAPPAPPAPPLPATRTGSHRWVPAPGTAEPEDLRALYSLKDLRRICEWVESEMDGLDAEGASAEER